MGIVTIMAPYAEEEPLWKGSIPEGNEITGPEV